MHLREVIGHHVLLALARQARSCSRSRHPSYRMMSNCDVTPRVAGLDDRQSKICEIAGKGWTLDIRLFIERRSGCSRSYTDAPHSSHRGVRIWIRSRLMNTPHRVPESTDEYEPAGDER